MQCELCKVKINDNNLGMRLSRFSEEEKVLCVKCERKHCKKIIKDVEDFKTTSDFQDVFKTRIKLLQIDEKMGFWWDAEIEQDSTCYNDVNLKDCQEWIEEYLYTLRKKAKREDEGF